MLLARRSRSVLPIALKACAQVWHSYPTIFWVATYSNITRFLYNSCFKHPLPVLILRNQLQAAAGNIDTYHWSKHCLPLLRHYTTCWYQHFWCRSKPWLAPEGNILAWTMAIVRRGIMSRCFHMGKAQDTLRMLFNDFHTCIVASLCVCPPDSLYNGAKHPTWMEARPAAHLSFWNPWP